MKKEEFLELAASKYEDLVELENSENLYEYEKQFDKLWRELGREVLNKNLGEGGGDRRKKKR